MFKNMKISLKILLVILIMSLGSLIVVFSASYYFMNSMVNEFQQTNITLGINSSEVIKDSLMSQTEYYLLQLTQKQAHTANNELHEVNRVVTEASRYTQSLFETQDNFIGHDMPHPDETVMGVASSKYFLAKGVEATPEVMKEVYTLSYCEYMFAPTLKENPILDNIYIGTVSGISYRYSRSNLFNPDYDPRKRDWYKEAMCHPDQLVWLPTYLDTYGNVCITAAMTYRDAGGNIAGVVASDVSLTSIIDDVMNLRIGETGSTLILDSDLNFIAHPDMDKEDFNTDISSHFAGNDFIKALFSSDNSIVQTEYEGNDCYVAFSRMAEAGWIFCASIETDEVKAPAYEAKAQNDILAEASQKNLQNRIFNILGLFMVFFSIIGIVVVMTSFAVSGTITKPIQRLAAGVMKIGKGEFNEKITVESGDEVGQLAERFNTMQDDLKNYMQHIKEVTAEKERIGTELSVATRIQAHMLPSVFPPYPDRPEIDVYACMHPAKEVGGDFYDFFFADETHFAMVIADVSGKGVPAALFMVITKTLIKDHVQQMKDKTLSEVLTEVNNQLCENNEEEMFATCWIGILDITTGKGVASNAGHEHPVIRRAGGEFELVIYNHTMALAAFPGVKFREHEFEMHPGDTLFVYTDGVPEATNSEDQLYGTDRMLEALNKNKDLPLNEVLINLKADVDTFVGEAKQFDDLTMLIMKYNGAD